MAGVLTPAQYTGSGGGAVSSVFGRSGAVTAHSGDYAVAQVTGAAALAGAAFTGEVTVQAPVNPSDAVTKSYAAAIAQGLSVKPSVQEATTAALPANTYSNGSSGVGATLTAVLPGVLTVDGIAVSLGDRVLVQNEAAGANNGIYVVTTLGTVSVAYVLTRAADMNTAAQVPGAFCFTEQGTANAGAGFTVASEGPFTIGTTAITWTQFSGAGEITAGTNLSKSGNTISLATSPALSGTPTAPTGTLGDTSTQIATDAFVAAAVGPYSKQTLAGPAASIVVTVPAGYNLLRLVVIGASSHASESDRFNVTVNAVSSGYDTQSAYGQNTSAAAGVQGNAAIWQGPTNDIPAASATSGVAGILDLQIPAYAATTFDKIGLWRSGYSDAATAAGDQLAQQNIVSLRSGTAAITSITVTLGLGGNFVTGTTALLYLS